MICVSLAENSLSDCLEAMETLDFAEIRLDAMQFLTLNDIRDIFSRPGKKLIVTCRPGGAWKNEDRKAMLLAAIDAGAMYVDVEVESEPGYREEILARARSCGCTVIISFHDHKRTPERNELETILGSCFKAGADIAKIACMVHSARDNARLLGLMDNPRPVIVVGMGEKGKLTRIMAPSLGSPFTFASLSKGKETANGQIDRKTLERILEGLAHP